MHVNFDTRILSCSLSHIPSWSGLNHFTKLKATGEFADGTKYEDLSKASFGKSGRLLWLVIIWMIWYWLILGHIICRPACSFRTWWIKTGIYIDETYPKLSRIGYVCRSHCSHGIDNCCRWSWTANIWEHSTGTSLPFKYYIITLTGTPIHIFRNIKLSIRISPGIFRRHTHTSTCSRISETREQPGITIQNRARRPMVHWRSITKGTQTSRTSQSRSVFIMRSRQQNY